jgi:hypothetical protein
LRGDQQSQIVGNVRQIQIAGPLDFVCHIFRHVTSPTLGYIEADNPHWIWILADVLKVGSFDIGFALSDAVPAEIVYHELDVRVMALGHNRWGPITHTQPHNSNSRKIAIGSPAQ